MKILICFVCSAIYLPLQGQVVYLGRVCDIETKKPIPNVDLSMDTVRVKTNVLGYFQITADTSKTLTARADGYESVLFKMPTNDRFIFYMRPVTPEKLMAIFYKFFSENIRFPSNARNRGLQGTSLVEFEIDSLGVVTKMNPFYGDVILSDEVMRVLKKTPSVLYAARRKTRFILPVVFKIHGTRFPKEDLPIMNEDSLRLPEIFVTAERR
jgi:hypothetical protein